MNENEKKIVVKMIQLFCKDKHSSKLVLCEECEALKNYAIMRLENCPYGNDKPTCGDCPIHCYKKDMRQKIRTVMRYSGPRMLLSHPFDAVRHFIREFTSKKVYK